MSGGASRFFGPDYVERATLRDGTPVLLRLVTPEDKPHLVAGLRRMSPESRYARFFAPKASLSEDELRYLTEIDQEGHFALGALTEDGAARGAGIARFIRLHEPAGTAEAAVAVVDDMHGRGLGKLLFLRLCAAAAERGVERFRCEVLGSNTGMRNLIEALAPEHRIVVGSGVLAFDMALPSVPATAPAGGPAPDSPMYRLFRAAAENAVAWTTEWPTAVVRRMWGGID